MLLLKKTQEHKLGTTKINVVDVVVLYTQNFLKFWDKTNFRDGTMAKKVFWYLLNKAELR